jgi:hypothetical protein
MKQHERKNKGFMGVAISAVLVVFATLNFLLPEVTLWPLALIGLALVTMLASHMSGGRHHARKLAHSEAVN